MKFVCADLSIYGERVFDSLPSLQWFLTPCLSNPRQSLTLRDIPPNSLNYWPPLTEKGDTSPQLNIVKRQILMCFVCKMFVCEIYVSKISYSPKYLSPKYWDKEWQSLQEWQMLSLVIISCERGQSLNVSDESCWEENIEIIVANRVAEVVRGHGGPSPKSLDTCWWSVEN